MMARVVCIVCGVLITCVGAFANSEAAMDAYLVKYIVSGRSQGYAWEFSDRLIKAVEELRMNQGIPLAYYPYRNVYQHECLQGCQERLLFTGAGSQIHSVIDGTLKKYGIKTDLVVPGNTVYVGLRANVELFDSSGQFIGNLSCNQVLKASTDWRVAIQELEDAIFSPIPDEREARMKWFKSFVTCPFDESAGNVFQLITVLASEPVCPYSEPEQPNCMLEQGISGISAGYSARH